MSANDATPGVTPVANGQIRELSKRVDTTLDLVRTLDTRMGRLDLRLEQHRETQARRAERLDAKLDKLNEGIATLMEEKARDEGAEEAEEKIVQRNERKIKLKANWIAAGSVAAVIFSAFATVFSTVFH